MEGEIMSDKVKYLLEATIAAHKRDLSGVTLATLLIIIDKPVAIGQIADLVGVSSAAMTGTADRLYLMGYARRIRPPGDRRKWLLEITQPGLAAIEAILNLP